VLYGRLSVCCVEGCQCVVWRAVSVLCGGLSVCCMEGCQCVVWRAVNVTNMDRSTTYEKNKASAEY
jgi:hypothetical protein